MDVPSVKKIIQIESVDADSANSEGAFAPMAGAVNYNTETNDQQDTDIGQNASDIGDNATNIQNNTDSIVALALQKTGFSYSIVNATATIFHTVSANKIAMLGSIIYVSGFGSPSPKGIYITAEVPGDPVSQVVSIGDSSAFDIDISIGSPVGGQDRYSGQSFPAGTILRKFGHNTPGAYQVDVYLTETEVG